MRLYYLFELIQILRVFFQENHFLETPTPPIVEHPGMETHIHPFQIFSAHKKEVAPFYLHTSPEFKLKQLLSMKDENFEKIYSLGYVFRNEPNSPIHRQQFLMLEWYEKNVPIENIIIYLEKIILNIYQKHSLLKNKPCPEMVTKTMQEMFQHFLKIDILQFLEPEKLFELIRTQFKDVPLPKNILPWDDLFFLLFLNKIEPHLNQFPLLIITDFPAPLSALAEIKIEDPRVAKRFELYIHGVEIANCYQELTALNEMEKRHENFHQMKKDTYKYELPYPQEFMQTMKTGIPQSSGIALGVERLLKTLTGIENPFFD